MIETMVEKHLSKFNKFSMLCMIRMISCTHLIVDPADLKPRSNLSIALGCIPHLIILAFAVIVVWTAKPSSSKKLSYNPEYNAPPHMR